MECSWEVKMNKKEFLKDCLNGFFKVGDILKIIINVGITFLITICVGKGSVYFIIWFNRGLVGINYATYGSYMISGFTFYIIFDYLCGEESK